MRRSFVLTVAGAWSSLVSVDGIHATQPGFWVPENPPRAHYSVTCRIDPAKGLLEGDTLIRFRNNSDRAIARLALDWAAGDSLGGRPEVRIEVGGKEVTVIRKANPLMFDLPSPVPPDKPVEIRVTFACTDSSHLTSQQDELTLSAIFPVLWWGVPVHNEYELRLDVPSEYAVAASGRIDVETGAYHGKNIRRFGLYLARNLQVIEGRAENVLVRCIHTPKGAPCAKLLLETAVDVVNYYRERFGFYPYPFLNVIPGMDYPAGGYPVATGIVAIHGQERFDDMPELHWRWITAHEIGHQYWGEWVLEKDDPGWLWIGMGIFADREYAMDRGLGPGKHRGLMSTYLKGHLRGHDTTMGITPEQHDRLTFDFNNEVIHGKGFSVISALACVLGRETFDRAYARCLEAYAGRRLGAFEFQKVCEEETGQDLSWFFDQWVRSNRHLRYEAATEDSQQSDDRYVSRVRVKRHGTLRMPVPVEARFEDGSRQRQLTDRTLDVQTLTFQSESQMTEAVIDPDGELAMVPSPEEQTLEELIEVLPRTGAGAKALYVFQRIPEDHTFDDPRWWVQLGLALYDGSHYPQALIAFERCARDAADESLERFTALVWQGQLLDLLERRPDALRRYQAALELDEQDGPLRMQHSQYGMLLNRALVEQRLKDPFERNRVLERIAALPYTGAGDKALELFEEVEVSDLANPRLWGKFGLALYDGGHYRQALAAFEQTARHSEEASLWRFTSLAWQGHLLDLLGRRAEALERYGQALEADERHGPHQMQHSQYNMLISRAWLERRLETPFERRSR